jgi:thiol-disulfide isomerase/thioredoxin
MGPVKRALACLGIVSALVSIPVLAGCGRAPSDSASTVGVTRIAADQREAMPALSGDTITGSQWSLADHVGQVVVVNNWASWCAPCRDEIPVLIDTYAKTTGQDVRFIGLNVSDEPAAAAAFAQSLAIPYPSVVDADGLILATIPGVPAKSLPSTVVVDKEGRIAARIIGPTTGDDLATIIDEVEQES